MNFSRNHKRLPEWLKVPMLRRGLEFRSGDVLGPLEVRDKVAEAALEAVDRRHRLWKRAGDPSASG